MVIELPMALFGVLFGALLSLLPIPRETGFVFVIRYLVMPLYFTKVALLDFGDNEPPDLLYSFLESIIHRSRL